MRLDYSIVSNWVAPNSRVLDLGCGDGHLLKNLKQELNIQGYGIEIDADKIQSSVENNINVIEQDIERDLGYFGDQSFDTVIMSQAIQTLTHPDQALEEMLRIGKECIITFPNFGHWKTRLNLVTNGRMPVSDILPYEWYNTPNIHFCTFKDFDHMCEALNARIINREAVSNKVFNKFLETWQPNLFGETALYRITKD